MFLITLVLSPHGVYAESTTTRELSPTYKGIKSPGNYGSIVLNRYTGGEAGAYEGCCVPSLVA